MNKIGELYESYVWHDEPFPNLEYFYKYIPKTYGDAIDMAMSLPPSTINHSKLSKAKKILKEYHQRLGILTPKVQKNIESLENGVVMAGQQSTIFGGVGLIYNKIACAYKLADISTKRSNVHNLIPFFFVSAHDSIQPEISTIHLPNYQSAINKPIKLEKYEDGLSSVVIETDQFDWLESQLSVMKNIFNEFRSSIGNSNNQKLFNEKVMHLLTFLRETYRNSKDLGEWVTLIYGVQANIINDWGIVFFPSSHPELRQLMVDGYKPFLIKRDTYIDEFNNATEKILKMELAPTTRKKKTDFVPFFYECKNDKNRLSLSYRKNGENITLSGKCSICKEKYIFDYDLDNIDLNDIGNSISPRLDSNQAIVNSIIPVKIRVSGPGEINYYAQVLPAIRKIGINTPIHVKYTRLFYNSPWIEDLAKSKEIGNLSLFNGSFFRSLGKIGKAKRKQDKEGLLESSKEIMTQISNTIQKLKETECDPISKLARYKSWQFGMYDENHNKQEVSWSWLVMASVTGLYSFLEEYYRAYSENLPIGGMSYLNIRL